MFKVFGKLTVAFLLCLWILAGSFCSAAEQFAAADKFDRQKYIGIDEIKPGMEAYCLTCYKGSEIEKFGLEVLSVVRNVKPGRDAILVQGTDERFIHTGPVAGCSGSPVYIDGRLAGALAFGWSFSKDPLYGVTPIAEMLRTGKGTEDVKPRMQKDRTGYAFDYSAPIDFDKIYSSLVRLGGRGRQGTGLELLPCPLITSGLPGEVCQQLNTWVEPFGFMAVSGIGGVGGSAGEVKTAELVPGACLAVPLVTGDITIDVIGTVTEVVGDKVYGFGHSFLGYGRLDLPMATGQVHTVVSSVIRSFKFASALEIVGALRTDESAAVCGLLGAKAKMIPLTIKVNRYNDTEKRFYNCQVADNQVLTPKILGYVVYGAALMLGSLPPEHTIEYKVAIDVNGAESVSFENVSTNAGLGEMIIESVGSVAILLNNPYKKVDIKSIDISIRQAAKSIASHIRSVDLSDSKVKAGQAIDVSVVVESFLAEKKKHRFGLKIPEELPPGKYDLIVCGGYGYQQFLRKTVPYKFIPQNLTSLIEVMNDLLVVRRDRLYCLLVLPPSGVAVQRAELPDLPATRALVLQDAKRTLRLEPYRHWSEQSLDIGAVVVDEKVMQITIEK